MAGKAESAIRTAIRNYINGNGGFAFVVSGSSTQASGIPDLDASYPSSTVPYGYIHCKLEVKTPVGKPTVKQVEILRMYHRQGYCVGIVTSVQDFKNLIQAYETYYLQNGSLLDILKEYNINDTYNIYEEQT